MPKRAFATRSDGRSGRPDAAQDSVGEDTLDTAAQPAGPAPASGSASSGAAPRTPVHPAPAVPVDGASAADLTDRSIVVRRAQAPGSGWRRALYRASAGTFNPGAGAADLARRDREARVGRALTAPHRIAVVSLKGGVGKTTVTAAVGLQFAELRGDRVAVLDADPDAGTLADRLSGETAVSVRDLAERADSVRALPELAHFTSLSGRLQVLASDQDPARDEALDAADYRRACGVLTRFCDVVLTDSGTGMVHSAVRGTLEVADSLVVVGSPTVDGAGRAARTLDWLDAHGYREAAARAVVVLSADRSSPEVDAGRLRAHFAARCRAVVELPHDPHLATGGRIRLAALRPATAAAVLEIAALLADEFGTRPPVRDC